jgi:pimeloyl-ACP methyl ester carboxylesterase
MTDEWHARAWPGPKHEPPVICLHALGGSSAHWAGVAPGLARLGAPLAVDLRHQGSRDTGGVSLEAEQRRLALLLERTGPAVIVGSSFGGGIALLQAAADPSSVRGLVLSGSMLPLVPGRRSARAQLIRRRLRQRGADVVAASRAMRDGRLRRGGLQEYLLRGNAIDPARMDDAVVQEIVGQPKGSAAAEIRSTIRAGLSSLRLITDERRFWSTIERVSAPVLVIHGDGDRTVPIAQALAVSNARPDWQLTIFQGIGHLPHLEDPERWLDTVVDWWPAIEGTD